MAWVSLLLIFASSPACPSGQQCMLTQVSVSSSYSRQVGARCEELWPVKSLRGYRSLVKRAFDAQCAAPRLLASCTVMVDKPCAASRTQEGSQEAAHTALRSVMQNASRIVATIIDPLRRPKELVRRCPRINGPVQREKP